MEMLIVLGFSALVSMSYVMVSLRLETNRQEWRRGSRAVWRKK